MYPVLASDLLHHQATGHEVIGNGERIAESQVDLLLAWRSLMMSRFHLDSHPLQRKDRLSPDLRSKVGGDKVEVTACIEHLSTRIGVKVEVLQLRTNVHREPGIARSCQGTPESPTGIASVVASIRLKDVADQASDVSPRQNSERLWIRLGDHVALIYPGKPMDR